MTFGLGGAWGGAGRSGDFPQLDRTSMESTASNEIL